MPPDGEAELDPNVLREENARLKSDLDLARRQAAEERGRADTLDTQVSQTSARAATAQMATLSAQETAAENTLTSLASEIMAIKRQKATLMAEGKFDEAADLDERLAVAAARRERAAEAKEYYGAQRTQLSAAPTDPVEQFLAANQGVYSAEDQQWIRQNRRFALDGNFRQRVTQAHNEAVDQLGLSHRSPEYYDHLAKRGYMRPDPPPAATLPAQEQQTHPQQEQNAAPSGFDGGDASSDAGEDTGQPQIIIQDADMAQNTQNTGGEAFGRRAENPQPRAAGPGALRAAVAAAPSRRSISETGRQVRMTFTQGERDTAMQMAPHMFSDEVLAGGEPAILQEYDKLRRSPTAERIRQGWIDRRG